MTGTATVGGVFDVEQWFLSSLATETPGTLPLYVSYLLLAYDDVYDVYRDFGLFSGRRSPRTSTSSSICSTSSTSSGRAAWHAA